MQPVVHLKSSITIPCQLPSSTIMSDLISTPTFNVGCFPGLRDAMSPGGASTLELQEVADDVAAEQETLPVSEAATDVDELGPEFAQLQATLLEASKGVTDGTDMEYKR